jgi:hypothetical protein
MEHYVLAVGGLAVLMELNGFYTLGVVGTLATQYPDTYLVLGL